MQAATPLNLQHSHFLHFCTLSVQCVYAVSVLVYPPACLTMGSWHIAPFVNLLRTSDWILQVWQLDGLTGLTLIHSTILSLRVLVMESLDNRHSDTQGRAAALFQVYTALAGSPSPCQSRCMWDLSDSVNSVVWLCIQAGLGLTLNRMYVEMVPGITS